MWFRIIVPGTSDGMIGGVGVEGVVGSEPMGVLGLVGAVVEGSDAEGNWSCGFIEGEKLPF